MLGQFPLETKYRNHGTRWLGKKVKTGGKKKITFRYSSLNSSISIASFWIVNSQGNTYIFHCNILLVNDMLISTGFALWSRHNPSVFPWHLLHTPIISWAHHFSGFFPIRLKVFDNKDQISLITVPLAPGRGPSICKCSISICCLNE